MKMYNSKKEVRRKAEKLINIDLFVSRFCNIEIVIKDCRICRQE